MKVQELTKSLLATDTCKKVAIRIIKHRIIINLPL